MGEDGTIPSTSHHQNDSCIKMGSDAMLLTCENTLMEKKKKKKMGSDVSFSCFTDFEGQSHKAVHKQAHNSAKFPAIKCRKAGMT